MGTFDKERFEPLGTASTDDMLALLSQGPVTLQNTPLASRPSVVQPVVGTLSGFDLDDRPLVTLRAVLPGEVVRARTAVTLTRDSVGRAVIVFCEDMDPYRPIIIGVVEDCVKASRGDAQGTLPVRVQADDQRYVISAKREIVLRCGDASITLTRAGKVIIQGKYIVSRSAGYNKIKGAVVDIN